MGKICESGVTCECPPKPCADGEEYPMTQWVQWAQEKWERNHSGHLNSAEARLWGALLPPRKRKTV